MQKTILAAAFAAVLGMGASAQAADLRTSGSLKDAPEAYVPAATWTGFFFGAGGGGGAVNHDLKLDAQYRERDAGIDLNGIGGMGGFATVQVGYDRQLDQHFVAGVFFDYDFANIDSRLTIYSGKKSASISSTLTDSWTVGGRAGYLVNANTLVYGLGGYTEAHFDMPFSLNGDFTGWTAGAGIETNLGGNLFLKGEYRFTQLDTKTLASSGSLGERLNYGGRIQFTDQPDIQTGRLVLTYKLNNTGYESLK